MKSTCDRFSFSFTLQGGRTPLYSAVIDGDEDLVQILLDAQADVNITAQVT